LLTIFSQELIITITSENFANFKIPILLYNTNHYGIVLPSIHYFKFLKILLNLYLLYIIMDKDIKHCRLFG